MVRIYLPSGYKDNTMINTTTPAPAATVETITAEQIGRAGDRFAEKCRKNKASLPKEIVQKVLEEEGDALAQEMFETLRRRVEARSKMIVRRVRVDRTLTPQQAIDATGRTQYVNADVLATMPVGEGDWVDVYLFPLEKDTSPADVDKIIADRGLVPDPRALAKVNQEDPEFAKDHRNGAQWRDSEGRACCAAFREWSDGGRSVDVGRVGDWRGGWLVGGVRKPAMVEGE
jgi:hypothetical protein